MINPNGAAQSATALLLIAGLVIESNKKFYFLGALVIMSVLVTLSRSGIVLSSLALFACFYYRSHYERFLTMKNTAIVAVAFFLAAVGGAYYLASTENVTILSRIEYLVSGQGFFDVEDPRIQLAKKYIDLWLQKPLLGFGTAATYSGDFNIVGATHNLYIKILVENGLLGLIMFLVALITCLFVSSNPIRFGVYIGWLVVIGWGFFANSLLDNRLFYTLVLVLVFSQSFMKSASEAARNKKILDL